jgi:Fic family protein
MPTYIYERRGWPTFTWDAATIAPLLAALRYKQGRLLGRMEGLGFDNAAKAELQALTTEIVTSSAIEGENLDADQVRSSLARRLGIDMGGLAAIDRDVEGIVEMMLDATQNAAAPMSRKRLFGWHASLFPTGRSGMRKVRVGAWRTEASGPMQVVSGPIGRERVHFEAPRAEDVNIEMSSLLGWYDAPEKNDLVLKAGVAHLWFVTIHPFEDGNGRIARALTDLLLSRSEGGAKRFYSMSSQIRKERAAYYEILERTQKGDLDITKWLAWFLGCLDRAIAGAETVVGDVLHKAEFWKGHERTPFNDRQRQMLVRLLDGFEGKLTSSKWAQLCKCSQDTASRDIDDLIAKGVLKKDPGGGRSTSYSLEPFPAPQK